MNKIKPYSFLLSSEPLLLHVLKEDEERLDYNVIVSHFLVSALPGSFKQSTRLLCPSIGLLMVLQGLGLPFLEDSAACASCPRTVDTEIKVRDKW